MNRLSLRHFTDAHKDKLSHCVMVFGAAGLAFYAAILVGGLVLKAGIEMLGLERGMML